MQVTSNMMVNITDLEETIYSANTAATAHIIFIKMC